MSCWTSSVLGLMSGLISSTTWVTSWTPSTPLRVISAKATRRLKRWSTERSMCFATRPSSRRARVRAISTALPMSSKACSSWKLSRPFLLLSSTMNATSFCWRRQSSQSPDSRMSDVTSEIVMGHEWSPPSMICVITDVRLLVSSLRILSMSRRKSVKASAAVSSRSSMTLCRNSKDSPTMDATPAFRIAPIARVTLSGSSSFFAACRKMRRMCTSSPKCSCSTEGGRLPSCAARFSAICRNSVRISSS
mmetsp:Transcript_100680/g.260004  ORF Transcript_100680/g.260004 Transcript_100680/m.260004 type:complete len:249 (+) Transcript_100680:324-1070(+)